MNVLRDAAIGYAESKWHIFPIGKNGKPIIKWKQYQTEYASVEEVRRWFNSYDVKKLGWIPWASGLWAMDADGPEAVKWMLENAPPSPIWTQTMRGRHHFYRAPPGVIIKNGVNVIPGLPPGNQIDIRGQGGMVIIPPSAHMNKNGEIDGYYIWHWLEGYDFYDPILWSKFVFWTLAGYEQGYEERPRLTLVTTPSASVGNLNKDLSQVKIPLNVGNEPVSQGERNVRLTQLTGRWINEGRTPEDIYFMALGWNLRNQPPLSTDEVERTVQSILETHARNHPGSFENQVNDDDVIENVADFQMGVKDDESDKIPDYLLNPGGFLSMFKDYVLESTAVSHELFAICAGASLLGTLMGQKVCTESELRTNLYFVCLSPSGTGKDAPLKAIPNLLRACDDYTCAQLLGPDQLASSAALVKALSLKPVQLILMDEIGDVMSSVKGKMDSSKQDLVRVLKTLFSATERPVLKSYANVSNNVEIWNHCLSIYMTGVPTALYNNLTVSDLTDGFLPRTVIISLDLEVKKPRRYLNSKPPEALVDAVITLNALLKEEPSEESSKENKVREPVKIHKTDEAFNFFDSWRDKYIYLQNKVRQDADGISSIYNRVPEICHKLALVHAISLKFGVPEKVELENVKYACDFLDWAVPRMVRDVKTHVAYNPQDALKRRILALLERKPYISEAEIYRNVRDCTHRQAEDVLTILKNAKLIVETRKFVESTKKIHTFYRSYDEAK
jgi:hypothetical protein